ncbi:disulfide bond formation protein DsbB [Thiogranum longum]|uniref:Disulfide bond formation protein DsbB n=1 Tax=Thiogranum longum TaxID=1537524 RepID=A0A4R1HCJ7_9GAMM|nr:disulfide bond formation protein B [Thiogranum longum]TCK17930.1 disulfide bond formation protein DsbB [Thiogranum longum]
MRDRLYRIARSAPYWVALALLALAMEGVALFYQYKLEYWPCVLCIHVRVWLLGLVVAGALGLLVRRQRWMLVLAHLLVVVVAGGMLERSLKLLGTERGTIEGSCAMESGLPAWFALDKWFPSVFQVMEPCGYTPELLFGITMAEALVVFSVGLLVLGSVMTLATLTTRSN